MKGTALKSHIIEKFYSLPTFKGFCIVMGQLGFKQNKVGFHKTVFISPKSDFVVKVAHKKNVWLKEWNPEPKKDSVLAQYYLYSDGLQLQRKYDKKKAALLFQPKVNTKMAQAALDMLLRELGDDSGWMDPKKENVGFYQGKPVIIDY